MRLVRPGPNSSGSAKRKTVTLLVILLLVIGAFAGWKIYSHWKNNRVDKPLTLKDQNSAATAYADDNLAKKNYDAAVQGCVAASATAFYQKDYSGSKDSLEKCVNQVPDANVPWYLYNSLAITAEKLNDKSLEKDSLQKAIAKASKSDSGVPAETITTMSDQLKSIK